MKSENHRRDRLKKKEWKYHPTAWLIKYSARCSVVDGKLNCSTGRKHVGLRQWIVLDMPTRVSVTIYASADKCFIAHVHPRNTIHKQQEHNADSFYPQSCLNIRADSVITFRTVASNPHIRFLNISGYIKVHEARLLCLLRCE